jgi:hypothetical protein
MAPRARPPRVEDPQNLEEGTGESSPPPWSPRAFNPDLHEVQRKICERLRQTGRHDRTLADPTFNARFARHLERLPPRYLLDLDLDNKVDDVLLHWRILDECADPNKRPVFHARFLKVHSFFFRLMKTNEVEKKGHTERALIKALSNGVIPKRQRKKKEKRMIDCAVLLMLCLP